jgi:hypothetical protein
MSKLCPRGFLAELYVADYRDRSVRLPKNANNNLWSQSDDDLIYLFDSLSLDLPSA